MLIKKHVRVNPITYQDIEKQSKQRNITPSVLIRELIDLGLRVKKHMENKSSDTQEPDKLNILHMEKGASAAIEALLLLRKMAKNINEIWVTEAHEDASKRIAAMQQKE